MKDLRKKIALVIVTHNSFTDIRECIVAARRQTYQGFDIIVVNNGSTDGTKEFLDEQRDVIAIHQGNVGGAGGFYSGQKFMYDNEYEWLWMMDDDGLPEEHQLENLLTFANKSGEKFLNALVINKDDRNTLSFGAGWGYNTLTELQKERILPGIHPFNGTFIHRSVIKKIGFIKKEMFIWGDEQEYTLRAKKYGYSPITVTNAVHYHPKEKGDSAQAFLFVKRFRVLRKPRHLSHNYYRNEGYINKQYRHPEHPWRCQFTVVHIIYWLRTFHFSEAYKFVKYYRKGVNGDFD